MDVFDRIVESAMVIVLIIGGYQFYFWAQRRRWFQARQLTTRWDGKISYDPRWVWMYAGLYYPMIVIAAWSIPTWQSFSYAVGAFLFLLLVQMQFFLFLPVEIPMEWRTTNAPAWEGTIHQRFLNLVWSFDKLRNSMPSMHVSVATMVDLTIWSNWPIMGYIGGLFPILIAVSALKTKQHFVVDVVPGAILGLVIFFSWNWWIV